MSVRDATRHQPLIGRSRERAELARALTEAHSGQARCVLIRGSAGMGKSRLLAEARRHELGRAFAVLHINCPELPASSGFETARELLATVTPQVANSGHITVDGLYQAITELLTTSPVMVIIDDLHRCDLGSLRWLDFLLRRAEDRPLLILLAYRSDELTTRAHAIVSGIAAQCASRVLDLAPLTEAEVGDVLAQAYPEPPHQSFIDTCARLSGGNPLLLHRLLNELGRVRPDAEAVAAVEHAGNNTVAESVLSRLRAQPERVRAVASAIAALGHGADIASVCALAGQTRWQVTEALDVLRSHHIVAGERPRFAHDAIRHAVLRAMPLTESDRLRAARILNDAGRPAVEVADHVMELSELNQTWMTTVLRDAAVLAERQAHPRTAVGYLRRVLDVETREPQRIQIRAELGRVLARIDPHAALPILRELIEQDADPDVRVSLVLNFAVAAAFAQRHPEAVSALANLLATLSTRTARNTSPLDRERCLEVESMLLILGSCEKSTFDLVRQRVEQREPPEGTTAAQRRTLAALAYVRALRGEPIGPVVEHARTALKFQANDADVWTERCSLLALHLADEVDDLLPAAQRSVETARNLGAPWDYSYARSCYARVLLDFGDVREAATEAQAAMEISEHTGGQDSTIAQRIAWACALVERGQLHQAATLLADTDRDFFDESTLEWHYYLHTKARVRCLQGDRTSALEVLRRCGRSMTEAGIGNPVVVPWRTDAIWLLAGLERRAEAAELLESDKDASRRWGTPRAMGRHLMARGAAAEDPVRAADHFTDAVEVLAGSPAWLEEARAHYRLGAALTRIEDVRGARKHLRRSLDLATLCGSRPIADQARSLAVLAGGRVGQPLCSPVELLTERERKVATMAASGTSNKEIAETLFVTLRTVETHLTNVYRKLRVSSRVELPMVLEALRTDVPPADVG